MSFLRKLLGAKEGASSGPAEENRPEPEVEKLLDPRVLVPLAPVDNNIDVVEYLKASEVDTAFARLNELKAARNRSRYVDYLRAHIFVRRQQPVAAIEALKEELRFFPDNNAAAQALASLKPASPPAAAISDPEFNELLQLVRPYTMVGEERLYSLYKLAREVCDKDIPGNFVECGVAAGGSSALLAVVIKRHSKQPRKLFSCDTFEGMPPSTDKDSHQGTPAADTGWGQGTCAAPIGSLLEAAEKTGARELVNPVQGLFAETLPKTKADIGKIAFLHVDGDWYESTMDVLTNLYDQVLQGAPIQVDDYGFWEGCKNAMEDFQKSRGIQFHLQQIDFTGVWFYKP